MTTTQKTLVRATFKTISNDSRHVAKVFYGQLFHLFPQYESAFQADETVMERRLFRGLELVVENLDRPGAGNDAHTTAPVRHPAESALQRTLQRCLGDGYTTAVESAWRNAYQGIDPMIAI